MYIYISTPNSSWHVDANCPTQPPASTHSTLRLRGALDETFLATFVAHGGAETVETDIKYC